MATDSTLIVSATYDDSYPEWYARLPDPKVRVSTAGGGHPSQAFIDTFRFGKRYHSYLFLQDSLEPVVDDVVAPFREKDSPFVGWASFGLFFDTPEQKSRVMQQYPYVQPPALGVFGPIFYAEHRLMERLDRNHRFPKAPETKMDAQGTERAWAYALAAIAVTPVFLHQWSNEFVASGDALPFRKVFAGRQ